MIAEAGTCIAVAGVSLGILRYRRTTRRLLATYGEEFRAYNASAFTELIEEIPDERCHYVTRLAAEIESRKGQKAVRVLSPDGAAIHHINQNGSFSSKGPYYISARSGNWKPTGRRHLVKVLRGKGGHGFKPDHGCVTQR
jgi:hypothetical protein